MKRILEEGMEEIVLCVIIPDCVECRRRVNELIMDMGCGQRVEIGYPLLHGTRVSLIYKNTDEFDFWERAIAAKDILQSFHYRVL